MPALHRLSILDAAAHLLRTQGWHAVTVRKVAAAAGVAVGTLRHYFPTQADLHATVAQMVTGIDPEDEYLAIHGDTPLEKVVNLLVRLVPGEDDLLAAPAHVAVYAAATGPRSTPEGEQVLEARRRARSEIVKICLELLDREGERRSDIPAPDQITILIALTEGLTLGAVGWPLSHDEMYRRVLTQVVRELVVAPAR